ncbi:hypothetical protein J6590_050423 [Homalodisca vitripennis]|nr:hypothetical protein J6590_050423 [Homalodisca vitripennis]
MSHRCVTTGSISRREEGHCVTPQGQPRSRRMWTGRLIFYVEYSKLIVKLTVTRGTSLTVKQPHPSYEPRKTTQGTLQLL